ncbi:MAG TPA: hypothetical protein VI942_06810, partial [Thermoanaerobaculia bacterium]|nr:hypothetical protein [Thermoanaerobaculia bacterium]
ASAGAAIDFTQSDQLVGTLQAHRFSMLWNLRTNAPWASLGNTDCYDHSPLSDCAPDAAHEDDLYDYIFAVVERYDADGVDDMEGLEIPVRFYLMTGEIEFAGSNSADPATYGDTATSHFWSDTVANLLRTHRIIYQAIHDADPSGATKLVSSGGVLWDLYADFPDYPAVDGETVQVRLEGDNNHDAVYTESFSRLVEMLASFGDDSDGVECDYVGWHPHMGWREIPQVFALIRALAPGKPIYVDDMWANLYLMDRADAPGYAQFGDGGASIAGDFPNPLVGSYTALRNSMFFNFFFIRDWYEERTARQLVKSFVTAFGEGAERVSFSGNADHNLDRLFGITGWLNLMGALGDDAENPFPEKPSYWTYRLLVEKLHDFSCVAELPVAADPHTRVYRFERPRGPIWIGWSETADAPPGLDYDLANGESVTFAVGRESLLSTTLVDEVGETEPTTATLPSPGGSLTVQLGYRPMIVEWPDVVFADGFECGDAASWSAVSG